MPIPMAIDVDTGIDDALALLLAARSPEADLLGVGTVAGNVDAPQAARNSLIALAAAGAAAVPVAVGATAWLLEPSDDARGIHGRDGLGETDEPPPPRSPSREHAVDQLLRLSREYAGELVVVAVGPLTNVALAMRADAGFAGRLARLVIMGGAATVGGNRSPWGEANVSMDPEAAAIVFGADAPRTMIGLDVTTQVLVDDDDVAALASSGDPAGAFAARILPHYLGVVEARTGQRRGALHDPLAVAAALDPSVVGTHRLPVRVETAGHWTRGMTVVDLRARRGRAPTNPGPSTDVALEVRAEPVRARLRDRLTAGAPDVGGAPTDTPAPEEGSAP